MSSFLHQTTTQQNNKRYGTRCICLLSYIKPQRSLTGRVSNLAVYVFFPTSNHNFYVVFKTIGLLYMSSFLHQTTTVAPCACGSSRCICLLSYIKPQRVLRNGTGNPAVYVFFPTSNHNCPAGRAGRGIAVYVFFPTSNHN